jgi:hypothetical protein
MNTAPHFRGQIPQRERVPARLSVPPFDSIDSPKTQHEESTTYAANFLQSEMFQLEHSAQCSDWNIQPIPSPHTKKTFTASPDWH